MRSDHTPGVRHGVAARIPRVAVSREAVRFGVLVGISTALLAGSIWAARAGYLTEETIRVFVERGGVWSPILFVVAATILPLMWVPRMMTSVVAGALFGFWTGTLLSLVGGLGGALAGYFMGWYFGHDYVMQKAGPFQRRLLGFIDDHAFTAIALLRICPVMNCELLSLGSGLTGVRMRVYITSSALGILPGSLLYAAFGSAVLGPDAAWVSLVSGILFVVLSAATGGWVVWMYRRDQQAARTVSVETTAPPSPPAVTDATSPAGVDR